MKLKLITKRPDGFNGKDLELLLYANQVESDGSRDRKLGTEVQQHKGILQM